MRDGQLTRLLDTLPPETILAELGVDYRESLGSKGVQLQVFRCPRCGGEGWGKVYLNAETGLGNCFHGSCQGEPGFNKFSFAFNHLGKDGKRTSSFFHELKDLALIYGDQLAKKKELGYQDDEVALPEGVSILTHYGAAQYLVSRGYDLRVAHDAGWYYCENGGYDYQFHKRDMYQDYSQRIVIPVRNLEGKLMTFQGRDISGEVAEGERYRFPPGLSGSGRYLYNADRIVGEPEIALVEGATDWLGVASRTEIKAVASFGKHLSGNETREDNDQLGVLIQLKALGLRKLVMMWDSDEKTQIQMNEMALLIRSRVGIEVQSATLPPGTDPGDATAAQIQAAYDGARSATKASNLRDKLMRSGRGR
jgi:DNA primase